MKKGTWLFGVVSALLFGIPAVRADILPPIARSILTGIFVGMPELYMQRFIIWLLFLCVYFFSVSFIFVDKQNAKRFNGVRVTIAVVLALITAIGIPDSIVTGIFTSFGWGAGIVAIIAPILGIMYVGHVVMPQSRFGDGLRAIFFLIGMVLVGAIASNLGAFAGQPPGFSLNDLAGIVIFFFFIMAIVNGVRALFGTREGGNDAHRNYNLGEGVPGGPGAGQVPPPQPPQPPPQPGLMTITSVAPDSATQGDGTLSLVITGTNLQLLDQISFPANAPPHTALQPAHPHVYNRTDAQCTVDVIIGNATPPVLYDIQAAARGQGQTFLRRAFTVRPRGTPPPTFSITRVNPLSHEQNTSAHDLQVFGTGLDQLALASVHFVYSGGTPPHPELQVTTVARVSATEFHCRVDSNPTPTHPVDIGQYHVEADNTAGIHATGGIYTITAPGTPPAFAFTGVSPSSVAVASSPTWVTVTISGTMLNTLDTAALYFGIPGTPPEILRIRNVHITTPASTTTTATCEVNCKELVGGALTPTGTYEVGGMDTGGRAPTRTATFELTGAHYPTFLKHNLNALRDHAAIIKANIEAWNGVAIPLLNSRSAGGPFVWDPFTTAWDAITISMNHYDLELNNLLAHPDFPRFTGTVDVNRLSDLTNLRMQYLVTLINAANQFSIHFTARTTTTTLLAPHVASPPSLLPIP